MSSGNFSLLLVEVDAPSVSGSGNRPAAVHYEAKVGNVQFFKNQGKW